MLRRIGYLLLLALTLAAWWWFERRDAELRTIRAADGAEIQVIDGDSLKLGADKIRIAGIDAPEYRQTCTDADGRAWPCGEAARGALERLVRGGGLVCMERATDRYGRKLADCRTGAGDVGAAMVRAGFALGARDPRFEEHEAELADARQARRGVWRGTHQHPADWRAAHPSRQRAD
ncbi:thermonuclease family protein [Sphingosinicella sp. LHD-64]|uniref:thermonuclease family protein n=1 Tax=Sphingosinicella sp. LHD-64 TaxID=3072139 RepID=UPI00280F5EF6|nr:thermonuclease family protein [Sphingosinicella sp. LHD-64]MDQ8756077.1 thermonuclease family protein [Sphingosinicella sp. LHD-64]